MARALMRWLGGKGHIAERIVPLINEYLGRTGGRLISPFYGSGNIERATNIPTARQIAAEAATELRMALETIRDDHSAAVAWALRDIAHLAGFSRRGYERVRSMPVGPQNRSLRAARFLFLNTYCFNGLWRVNKADGHNVPPDPARLERGAELLPDPQTISDFGWRVPDSLYASWGDAFVRTNRGDLLLIDPPYLGGFVGYTAEGFDLGQQELLAGGVLSAVGRGVAVIAFNSETAAPLYSWANIEVISRSGCMNSDGGRRKRVNEILITAGMDCAHAPAAANG